ncbi:P-loop containing nucleoside triphosphate hydrolase protein [Limtongia smithiae]|uniref:P-loop containing nucleoside triphosphate hydrolase protein n=1 Tax=Limtongia smithiae TaxID=1125753 RepID=UPI0034CF5D79
MTTFLLGLEVAAALADSVLQTVHSAIMVSYSGNDLALLKKPSPRPKRSDRAVHANLVVDDELDGLPQSDVEILHISTSVYEDLTGFTTWAPPQSSVDGTVNGQNGTASDQDDSVPQPPLFVSMCLQVDAMASVVPQWNIYSCALSTSLSPFTVLLKSYSTTWPVQSNSPVLLQPVTPVRLTHVILRFSPPAYDFISNMPKYQVSRYFDTLKILRRGQYLPILDCEISACDPVDQGIISTGRTKFTFVKDNEFQRAAFARHDSFTDNNSSMEELDDDLTRFLCLADTSQPGITIGVASLRIPTTRNVLVPTPKEVDDIEAIGLVGLHVLAKLGIFSGDWVMLKTSGISRPIMVYSFPLSDRYDNGKLYVSPILLHNLHNPDTIQLSPLAPTARASIQVAKEITISRVLSSISSDRTLLQASLQGLRTYFDNNQRVVAKGDLIAIPIDEPIARLLYVPGPSDENSTFEEITSLQLPIIPSGIAWFQITSIAPPAPGDSLLLSGDSSAYLICTGQTRVVQTGTVSASHPPVSLPWMEYLSLKPLPTFQTPVANRVRQLLSVCMSTSGAALQTAIIIHSAKRGVGKTTMVRSIAAELGVHVFAIESTDIAGDTDVKTLGTLIARLERARDCAPCVVLLRHLDAIAKKVAAESSSVGGGDLMGKKVLDAIKQQYSSGQNGLVVVATSSDIENLSEEARKAFNFEVEMGAPTEKERQAIFEYLTSPVVAQWEKSPSISGLRSPFLLNHEVKSSSMALQSAGLVPSDLVSIVNSACSSALDRLDEEAITETSYHQQTIEVRDLIAANGGYVKLTAADFETAIGEARRQYSDSIGAPRIPKVKWEDVGGLADVKSEILDTIEMPLKFPALFSGGIKKRSGILFYGPPGTGKTLLAKAIATTFSLNFFSVKGPELLNMYIGESEANVRRVFQRARDARPCVVFFDELDSVAPKRGNQGDSGGVMDRIVSQLLAELDGMSSVSGEGVFVIGATNRPDLLDSSLLRPGRFDKMLYLGVPDTHDKQLNILKALTRKFTLSDDLNLAAIAESCPFTYTGADFYALCSDAMLNAMTRMAYAVEAKVQAFADAAAAEAVNAGIDDNGKGATVSTRWWFDTQATKEDVTVVVRREDFEKARRELVASVSENELRHYAKIREKFPMT